MSETPGRGFAEADALVRWWGIERSRVVLVALALVLYALAVVAPAVPMVILATVMFLGALGTRGRPLGALGVREFRRLWTRRTTWIEIERGESTRVTCVSSATVWCHELVHRGRLDLAGADAAMAAVLADLTQSLALAEVETHLSLHLGDGVGRPTTLALSTPVASPPGWRATTTPTWPATWSRDRTPVVVRRRHLRVPGAVTRVSRVEGFAPGREAAAVAHLAERLPFASVSVHARVVPAQRARRQTARLVHGLESAVAARRAVGFRVSARGQRELEAARVREIDVAAGAALCRWALYLEVWASGLEELARRQSEARAVATAAGLRLDDGVARQGEWLRHQLPGGLGW